MTDSRSPFPLRTDRLLLRPVHDEDLADMLAYYGDPDVCRYLPFAATDEAGVRDRIEQFRPREEASEPPDDQDDVAHQAMIELDGRVVGDLMLRLKGGSGPRTLGELGWVLNPSWHGRGIAFEGARLMMDLAFGHYGCHRVFANLDPRNGASARLCERLGMTHEGHTRQDYWAHGEWADTTIYGILRAEWERR